MRKFLSYILYTLLIASVACACSDDLDIVQSYGFDLETLPVRKEIKKDETIEIRCQIVREGNYSGASYELRCFQTDGSGTLRLDDGTVFLPNDLYPLDRMTFRLYYTSHCTENQNIDIYIIDNAGQVVKKSFSFQNNSDSEEEI